MKLVEFVPPTPHLLWQLCKQMGIDDVVIKVNPARTGLADPWKVGTLKTIVARLASAGLRVVALEGDPFDMAPIKEYGAPNRTDEARSAALAHYRELLESMATLGIPLLCYNFMIGPGWSRTGVREGRGGAKATYFACTDSKDAPNSKPLILDSAAVWTNYEHFLENVLPTAERVGVRLALHPDDPCLESLGGFARIFGSVAAYDRAYKFAPSRANAVTFCQANFTLMGVDLAETARHFAKRIAYIHVRDVEGTKEDFTELFHDQGKVDQFALMCVYRELGLDVPLRGDHVPEMAGDSLLAPKAVPGYTVLGRLFANGYLKALLQGTRS